MVKPQFFFQTSPRPQGFRKGTAFAADLQSVVVRADEGTDVVLLVVEKVPWVGAFRILKWRYCTICLGHIRVYKAI
jgi:hypothetical protein